MFEKISHHKLLNFFSDHAQDPVHAPRKANPRCSISSIRNTRKDICRADEGSVKVHYVVGSLNER